MEISVVDVENAPPGCLLSLAPTGASKRQAPLLSRQKFAWRNTGNGTGLTVQVLSVLADAQIGSDVFQPTATALEPRLCRVSVPPVPRNSFSVGGRSLQVAPPPVASSSLSAPVLITLSVQQSPPNKSEAGKAKALPSMPEPSVKKTVAPDAAQEATPEAVAVSMTVQNIDFTKLGNNTALSAEVETVIRKVVAAVAGDKIRPEHVAVSLPTDCNVVGVMVTPARTCGVETVFAELRAAVNLPNILAKRLIRLASINSVQTGAIRICNISHSTVFPNASAPLASTPTPLSHSTMVPNASAQGASAAKSPPCRSSDKDSDGRQYIEKHGLLVFVEGVLRELLNQRPSDPWMHVALRLPKETLQAAAASYMPKATDGRTQSGDLVDTTAVLTTVPQLHTMESGTQTDDVVEKVPWPSLRPSRPTTATSRLSEPEAEASRPPTRPQSAFTGLSRAAGSNPYNHDGCQRAGESAMEPDWEAFAPTLETSSSLQCRATSAQYSQPVSPLGLAPALNLESEALFTEVVGSAGRAFRKGRSGTRADQLAKASQLSVHRSTYSRPRAEDGAANAWAASKDVEHMIGPEFDDMISIGTGSVYCDGLGAVEEDRVLSSMVPAPTPLDTDDAASTASLATMIDMMA